MHASLVAHQALWSKQLPNGSIFDLQPVQGTQLQWGKFRMSSDSISNSYMTNGGMREIVLQAETDAEELFRIGSKIGSYILFPAYQVDRKVTINAARGMSSKIADRMDLTLEAIRRHYSDDLTPLTETLNRYADFFELFQTFDGYVDFWLLNDLVDENYEVKYFLPFDNYERNAAPKDLDEYLQLKTASVDFLSSRTARMECELL